MIAIVSTSPALDVLAGAARDLAPVEIWAPLAAPSWLARAPRSLAAFARRRQQAHDRAAPPLLIVEAALRGWARSATDRRYRAELALRVAIDRWAAREVMRRHPRVVIAPTLAARHTFAAARAIGAATMLVLDRPLLRVLHHDLDRAAERWPERRFLRRYRAPSWAIARQEAERVLADLVLVRGAYARACNLADGVDARRLGTLPAVASGPAIERPPAPTGRIRLAGLGAARHGIDTALAAAHQLGLELVVRIGEGSEPADLARRRGVSTDAGPVDAVICPAICETYAPELVAAGVPVIASPMASHDGSGPDPYAPDAFAVAIHDALRGPAPPPYPAPRSQLAAITALLAALL